MAGSARPALYVVLSASCLPFLGLRLCRSAERFYATPNVCAFVQGVDLSVRAHLGLSQVTCPGGGSGCSRGTVQVKHTPSHVLGGDIFGSSFCLFPSLQALPAALGTLCLLLTLRAKGRARRVAGPPCLSIPHIRACSQLHPPSDSDPPPPPPACRLPIQAPTACRPPALPGQPARPGWAGQLPEDSKAANTTVLSGEGEIRV